MEESSAIIIHKITGLLRDRIDNLEELNNKHRESSRILVKYLRSVPINSDMVDDENQQDISDQAENNDILLSSVNLVDDILRKAKSAKLPSEMQPTVVSDTKQNKQRPVKLATYAKSSVLASTSSKVSNARNNIESAKKLDSGLKQQKSLGAYIDSQPKEKKLTSVSTQPQPQSPQQTPVSSGSTERTARYNLHDHVAAQMDFFRQHKPLYPHSALVVSKRLYCEQTKFLSKLAYRTVHPQSLAYKVMSPDLFDLRSPPARLSKPDNTFGPPQPLKQQSSKTDDSSSSSTSTSGVGAQQHKVDAFALKLKNAFVKLIDTYEKHFKQRLSRTSSAQLTATDREELLALWLRSRKLVELYEHYCYRVKRQQYLAAHAIPPSAGRNNPVDKVFRCKCEVCVANYQTGRDLTRLAETLVDQMPLHTPITVPKLTSSGSDGTLGVVKPGAIVHSGRINADSISHFSKLTGSAGGSGVKKTPFSVVGNGDTLEQWRRQSEQDIELFHDLLESRVRCAVEASVGQIELMQSIRRLKSCSEKQVQLDRRRDQESRVLSTGSRSSEELETDSKVLMLEWREALGDFRAVHCMLAEGAQDASKIVFLDKSAMSTSKA